MLAARPYTAEDEEAWDKFVSAASNTTLLHTRRFLSYHGERFIDRSLLIESEGDLIAVLPAAEHPTNNKIIVSHPGITYGGILVQQYCHGERLLDALLAASQYYRSMGYECLHYKTLPFIYQKIPAQDDIYALFRLGAQRYRCDISATIDLYNRGPVGSRRRRGLIKAKKAGLKIAEGVHFLEQFWSVLAENLQLKHGAKPVHSIAELTLLAARFPDDIKLITATQDGAVIAGVLLFESTMVSHAQYIASSDAGYKINALDMVFDHVIERATQQGKRYFDFGISTESGGTVLNSGLYEFKREFGAGGVVHEFYELSLQSLT